MGKEELVDSDQGSQSGEQEEGNDTRGRSKWWLLLLLLPFTGLLYPAIYAREDPALWGLPFFIWYQFLWVFTACRGDIELIDYDGRTWASSGYKKEDDRPCATVFSDA